MGASPRSVAIRARLLPSSDGSKPQAAIPMLPASPPPRSFRIFSTTVSRMRARSAGLAIRFFTASIPPSSAQAGKRAADSAVLEAV